MRSYIWTQRITTAGMPRTEIPHGGGNGGGRQTGSSQPLHNHIRGVTDEHADSG